MGANGVSGLVMAISSLGPAGIGSRRQIAFRGVDRPNALDYNPGLQRHHLLPLQLLSRASLRPLLREVGRHRLNFDDFRYNGLLLPARDDAVVAYGLPLHRGPHRPYNAMVIERVGQIEAGWAAARVRRPHTATEDAVQRLTLLQRALRRRLLDQRRPIQLNRRDPLRRNVDFAELDAMADLLWPATALPEL